jgi:hypothetical protein
VLFCFCEEHLNNDSVSVKLVFVKLQDSRNITSRGASEFEGLLLAKCNQDDEIKEDEIGWECNKHKRKGKCI